MTTVKSLSREMKFFLLALIPIYFISVGLIIQPFDSIVTGIYEIIWEPDFLITDYIAVGGMGAAFVNAGMMALISIYFVYSLGMEMDGHTITSCCLMFGFSLFGKNLMNIWAIFLGVFLYASSPLPRTRKTPRNIEENSMLRGVFFLPSCQILPDTAAKCLILRCLCQKM